MHLITTHSFLREIVSHLQWVICILECVVLTSSAAWDCRLKHSLTWRKYMDWLGSWALWMRQQLSYSQGVWSSSWETETIIDRLIGFMLGTGLLTTMVAVGCLITVSFVTVEVQCIDFLTTLRYQITLIPNSRIYIGLYYLLTKRKSSEPQAWSK